MDINQFAYIAVPTFVIGEVVVRLVMQWREGRKTFPFRDVLINFSIGLVDRIVTGLFWVVLMFSAFSYLAQILPYKIDMSSIWAWPLAILLSDFAFYCYHRAGHEVRLFWAIHNVHHSSTHYNFSTSIRLSWFEGLFRWPFWVILPLAGFSAEVSMIAYMVVRLYQVLLHNEYVRKLSWLEYVLCTPSHHRVHHARNPHYLDRNYGGMTILWDRLFGTFEEEVEAVDYGLVKQLESHNLLWINVHEFLSIGKDLKKAKNLREKFFYVFGRPGWNPQTGNPELPSREMVREMRQQSMVAQR